MILRLVSHKCHFVPLYARKRQKITYCNVVNKSKFVNLSVIEIIFLLTHTVFVSIRTEPLTNDSFWT